jgi:hypothetical protein
MARETFAIAAIVFVCSAATPPPATVVSPCECRDNHARGRWAVKNDPSLPPKDAKAIRAVAASDMYRWPGIGVQLNWQSERTGIENNWYALTGRVVATKIEADGDLHLALQDANRRETRHRCCRSTGRTAVVRNSPGCFWLDADALPASHPLC